MCARLVKKIWCDYIIDCSCYSEENKNRHNFLCATAWITIVAKSDVWIAITFSLLMQMPRFTYHFNSFNLLFKAIPNLVQNIAFEKNIPVPTISGKKASRRFIVGCINVALYAMRYNPPIPPRKQQQTVEQQQQA